jgi:hypothetical protein
VDKISETGDQAEFVGDQCVVLPKGYLQSAEAVSEIYAVQLAAAAANLDVDDWNRVPGFFRGTLPAAVLWALPSIWTVCQ